MRTPEILSENKPSNLLHQNTSPSAAHEKTDSVYVRRTVSSAALRPPAIVLGVYGLHDSSTDVFICLSASRSDSQERVRTVAGENVADHQTRCRLCVLLVQIIRNLCVLIFARCLLFHFQIPCFCKSQTRPNHGHVPPRLEQSLSLLAAMLLTLDPFPGGPSVWGVEVDFATELCKWEWAQSWLQFSLYFWGFVQKVPGDYLFLAISSPPLPALSLLLLPYLALQQISPSMSFALWLQFALLVYLYSLLFGTNLHP